MNAEEMKRWVAQWKAAGSALKAVRAEELSRLDEAQTAAIASSFFVVENPQRQKCETSGLVEQQAIFQRARLR